MNKRIKELLAELDIDLYTDEGVMMTKILVRPKDLRQFAELIVKECYETIKKDMELAHIQLIPIDFRIYANGRLRRIIKEHFGVEFGVEE